MKPVTGSLDDSGQTKAPAGLTNAAPQVASGAAPGYANHDLVITWVGADPNGEALNFRVAALPG